MRIYEPIEKREEQLMKAISENTQRCPFKNCPDKVKPAVAGLVSVKSFEEEAKIARFECYNCRIPKRSLFRPEDHKCTGRDVAEVCATCWIR